MKIKDIKNGDKITVKGTVYVDAKNIRKTLSTGTITVENSIYIRTNAIKAGQEDMEAVDWYESHPHCWNIKDSDLTLEFKEKAKQKYGVE